MNGDHGVRATEGDVDLVPVEGLSDAAGAGASELARLAGQWFDGPHTAWARAVNR